MSLLNYDEDDEPLFSQDIGTSNVVPLDSRRAMAKPPLPGQWFADREEGEYNPEDVPYVPGQSIAIYDPANKALQLAREQDFLKICEGILWPGEEENIFGELLRGLVIEFMPKNAFQLHLLANIADCQWSLRRLQNYKQSAYLGNKEQRGRYGMPVGTDYGLDEIGRVRQHQAALKKAIDTYRAVADD